MALSIVNWNIYQNRAWFVRLADTGSAVSIELYLTQADAQAQSNMQASGESSGYGSGLEIVLENESEASTPVSLFQDEYSWHLIVSGQNGDAAKIFKVKEFVEADEISHAIYRNSSIISSRAAAEINAHTHAAINRNISIKEHYPEMDIGNVIKVTSSRHGIDDLNEISELQIIGTANSLINEIEAIKYLVLKR